MTHLTSNFPSCAQLVMASILVFFSSLIQLGHRFKNAPFNASCPW